MLFTKASDAVKSVDTPDTKVDKHIKSNVRSSRPDFDNLNLTQKEIEQERDDEVKVSNFLKLFITQLQNQNPLEPENQADFLGQLAQFSSVEGLSKIEQTVENLVKSVMDTRSLQVSSLIGRQVDVSTNKITLTEDNEISGSVNLEEVAEEMKISFKDSSGQVVKVFDVGEQMPGNFKFKWDGKDANGNRLPPGAYRIDVEARVNGSTEKMMPMLATPVESVEIDKDSGTYTLSLATSDKVDLSKIKEIK